jgi:hypothetical protein
LFLVTPTYDRPEQEPELVRLGQTLQQVVVNPCKPSAKPERTSKKIQFQNPAKLFIYDILNYNQSNMMLVSHGL